MVAVHDFAIIVICARKTAVASAWESDDFTAASVTFEVSLLPCNFGCQKVKSYDCRRKRFAVLDDRKEKDKLQIFTKNQW